MALTQVQGGMIASSQTITSPTLTTPTITSPTINGTYTADTSLITSGTAVASTSGTSIDFTSIPSWVKRITVMFNGVSTNGSNAGLIQIGSGSVTTSGYVSQSTIVGASSGTQASTSGFVWFNSSGAEVKYGQLVLTTLGSNIWVYSGVLYVASGYTAQHGGGITLGGTLDRVRITTSGGTDTFDAGSINILYE